MGDSIVHFKLIYMLHFNLFTYFKIIVSGTFLMLFLLSFVFLFFFLFWQSYQGISVAQIHTFRLSKSFQFSSHKMMAWNIKL